MPHPRYGLVAFDFDGTLADTIGWFEGIMDDVSERYGLRKPDPAERERLRQCDAREVLKRLDLPLWKMPSVLKYVRTRMAESGNGFDLFPGVRESLAALRDGGVWLAVLSSNSEENVRRVLGPRTAELVHVYACGTDLFGKAGKMRGLLRGVGIPAERTLLVGDEIRDIEAARSARVAAGAVTWGYNREEALRVHAPDLVFRQVGELAPLILARGEPQR